MHPPLSDAAKAALRGSTVHLVASADTLRELEAWQMVARVGAEELRLTVLGARYLLDLLLQEEAAVPCRCGDARGEHDHCSPHACFVCGECRSFAAARPILAEEKAVSTVLTSARGAAQTAPELG